MLPTDLLRELTRILETLNLELQLMDIWNQIIRAMK